MQRTVYAASVLLLATLFALAGAPTSFPVAAPTSAPAMAAEAPKGATPAKSEPIKIGLVNPLTGTGALTGEASVNGFKMAMEEMNASGGLGGRTIKLVIADDEGKAATGVDALNKLIYQEKVEVLFGPDYSAVTLAVMDKPAKEKIPTFVSSVSPKITQLGNKWIFRLRPHQMIATKLMSDYVSNELKLNRVAILHSRGEYGESARDGLQENLQKAGVQIVRLESFNQGDKDLTSQLLNLKRANANGIIFWGYAAEGVIYAKQKKQLDVPGPLLVNNDVVSQVALKLGAADLEGAVGPAEFIPTDPDPRVQQFTDKYKKKYGDIAIDFHAPLYYDGLRILAEAVKLGGGTRNDQIQAGILKVKNFKTFVGTYSYDGNGDVGVAGLLVQIKNGNPIILKRY